MSNTTAATSDLLAGASIRIWKVKGPRKRQHHYEAQYHFDPSKCLRWRPGMEAAAEFIGKGKSRDAAVLDCCRQVMALAEEVGIVAFTRPVLTFRLGEAAAATSGVITFPL